MNTNPQPDALRSRWTLEGRIPLSGVADGAVWHRARSVATGESVVLFIVRGEAALEAADAVRRAYLVEDPRLLAVNDIVVLDDPREDDAEAPTSPDGPTTVVEYALPPAPPLAALLSGGPLHPETARAIVGEAATGLEVARRRGVRHQFIDSNRVFVDTRSGAVVVLGVGVEAAAHLGLDRSREAASFQDTAALVALLYRALTGRSPRHDASGDVPRPSTITDTAIPEDLDLLCDLVLNESADEIPETTRELIEVLQPWQSIPVTIEAYSRGSQARQDAPVEDVSDDELESTALMAAVPAGDEPSDHDEAPTGEAVPAEDSAPADGSVPADASTPAAAAAVGTVGAAGAVGAAAMTASAVDRADEDEHPAAEADADADGEPQGPDAEAERAAAADREAAAAADAEKAQQSSTEAKALVEDLHLDQKRSTSPFPGHLAMAPGSSAPAASSETAEEAPAGPGAGALAGGAAAGAAVAGAAAALPARTSGTHWPLADSEGDPSALAPGTAGSPEPVGRDGNGPSAATPDHSAPTPSEPVTHSADAAPTAPVAVSGRSTPVAPVREDGPIVVQGRDRSVLRDRPEEGPAPFARSSLLRDVVGVAVDKDAPETFTMGPRDSEKRSLQSQWIIIGGALAVMIALVIALTTITSDIRDILKDPLATSEASASPTPTEEDTGEAPVEPTAEDTEEALPAPKIESVELSSLPGGTEPDHTDQQDRLTDGDPSTFWSTQHYASPDYGGLKEGVGMRVQFAEPSTFTALTLTTARNNGGLVQLRAVNEDGSPGDVLASGEFVGDGEVRLEAPKPIETDKVMVWVPELPPDSGQEGRFRARIAEITVE